MRLIHLIPRTRLDTLTERHLRDGLIGLTIAWWFGLALILFIIDYDAVGAIAYLVALVILATFGRLD